MTELTADRVPMHIYPPYAGSAPSTDLDLFYTVLSIMLGHRILG